MCWDLEEDDKWATSDGPRPSDGWIKIGEGGITNQTWNILAAN
jgi:hypothetical protein